ncbi:MAG: hypothetical protein GY724_23300 [Actinomycetia bacterium]|nr:hypothetical protein [Actinomycetes bacterium]MCP5031666.1 hypothetical protein [Actinomycetes bacterium]
MSDPTITPTPTDEEVAAIAAALVVAWPRRAADDDQSEVDPRWRFSGRWWNGRPSRLSRQRPWRR